MGMCAHGAASLLGRGFGFFGFPFLGGFFSLAILALIIFAVVMISRRTPMSRPMTYTPTGTTQSPLDIAKSRYAKGEINKDEYESLRQDLES